MVGLVIGLAVGVGLIVVIGLTRTPPAELAMTSRSITMDVPLAPDQVFARLSASHPGKLTLLSSDPARRSVLLESPMTPGTWGFYYPVEVTPREQGSRVQVGIRSRFYQYGPLVTRAHRTTVAMIAAWLS